MPVRRFPRPGDDVTVAFLAARVDGVVAQVDQQRRRLYVVTDEGEAISFVLSPATGQFVADDSQASARLLFHKHR